MKTGFLIVIFILTLAFAFVSIRLCLYTGIVDIIKAVQTSPLIAGKFAWGLIKCLVGFPGFGTVALICGLLFLKTLADDTF